MTITKYYDPKGKYAVQFAGDDYDGVMKFIGDIKNPEFKVVKDLTLGEVFQFRASIKMPEKINLLVRTSYEEISEIFDEISDMIILSDFDSPKEMWREWDEILLEHGWTSREWEEELNRRINEKHHIFPEKKDEEDSFEGITINNDSIIYSYWKSGRHEKVIPPSELIHFLWENIRLNDITLGRIFDIVETNIDLWEIITAERIKPIIEESKKEFNGSGELEYLEIYWDNEHDHEYETFVSWPSFHAIGKPCEDDYLPEELNGHIYYGISLTPNNYLKILPLRLKTLFKIYSSDDCHDSKYFGNKEYKVLEMIKAIFWELTWFGTPEEREKRHDEIIGDVEEDKKRRENIQQELSD